MIIALAAAIVLLFFIFLTGAFFLAIPAYFQMRLWRRRAQEIIDWGVVTKKDAKEARDLMRKLNYWRSPENQRLRDGLWKLVGDGSHSPAIGPFGFLRK